MAGVNSLSNSKIIDRYGNEKPITHNKQVLAADIDNDGNIYYGHKYGYVRKFNFESNQEIFYAKKHNEDVYCVSVDTVNGYFYSGSLDNTVRKYDTTTGNEITNNWPFTGNSGAVYGIAADPVNGYVYSVGSYGYLRKINANTGNEVTSDNWPVKANNGAISSVTVDKNGYIYSVFDSLIHKFDPSTGSKIWSSNSSNYPVSVAVDNNGYAYVGTTNSTVHKYSVTDGTEITSGGWPFDKHTGGVRNIAAAVDGTVYTGSRDDTVKKINSDGTEAWTYTGFNENITAVAVGIIY